ncbi:hypothetical protein GZ78_16250 [Endozoicomonas numazuensis]|uniref:Uncharacterized protein n=1 Tax=Endozoicomonas numazuensis TaxID=1137799 RepID=A0A081NFY1_9GAMM|nr:hypothetical protein GZ78_16250 [Endozoicomonas numazuensis]
MKGDGYTPFTNSYIHPISPSETASFNEQINQHLLDINLQSETCLNGKSIGEGSSVRVLDIQHTKGLEFETMFFLRVDTLTDEKNRSF